MVHNELTYHWIYIEDEDYEPIHEHFEDSIKFINEIDGAVLIHCWAGISRSPTIAIAYIMKNKSMSYDEAFNYVLQRRSIICPNFGFQAQLTKYNKNIT